MDYYKVDIKSFYPNERIASRANGKKIPNANFYFYKMREGEIIKDAPVFDYFFLESYDKKKYWEWQLTDVYNFIGEGSQILGWFVSKNLKSLLENFNLAKPYYFYPSKLLYKKEKLDYYIFQFDGNIIYKLILEYIIYSKSIFFDPTEKDNVVVKNIEDFFYMYKEIYKKNNSIDMIIQNKKLVLKELLDFFPMSSLSMGNLVSERLKQAIGEMGITGFEFSELDYEVVVEQSSNREAKSEKY